MSQHTPRVRGLSFLIRHLSYKLFLFQALLILSLLAFAPLHARADAQAPQGAVEAARAGLPSFLSKIPYGTEGLYGFQAGDVLHDAVVGEGFQLYSISTSAVQAVQPADSVDGLSAQTDQWFFPIVVNGASRTCLIVDKVGGSWEAVSLGYSGLAREFEKVRRHWQTPRLLASFQARKYFFHVPQVDRQNLTALSIGSAPSFNSPAGALGLMMDDGYGRLSSIEQVVPELKEELAKGK